MRNLTLFAFVLASLAAGCRGDSSNNPTPDAPDNTTGMKIQDIQNDSMPSGTAVTLKGVVVTAIDNYGAKKGDIWIEEPGGGPFSGIHVYGAPLDQVAALTVGDVVDVAGAQKDEFVYNGTNGTGGFPAGYGITELKPVTGGAMTITKTGANTPITPDTVDALAIGQMADYMARDAEWEKWEGVLIKVSNVSAASSDKCVGSGCTDPTLHSFDITGGAVVESGLGPMPTPTVKQGDCLGSVTGPLDYFFNYQVLPRDINNDGTTEDFALAGGNCPVENSPALCSDGIDNDGNGFADCNDNACLVAASGCSDPTTISALQPGGTPPTRAVSLTDVYVSARAFNKKSIWVQDGLTAATDQGIYVIGPGGNQINFTQGQRVNIIGTVTEYNNATGTGTLTEIKAASITAGTVGANTVVPVAVTNGANTDALNTDGGGEPYESVLVKLSNVKVTTLGVICSGGATPPACNYGTGAVQVGNTAMGKTTIVTNSDVAILAPAGTCYASVDGIWSYDVYADTWVFLPLTTAGTGTGNCN